MARRTVLKVIISIATLFLALPSARAGEVLFFKDLGTFADRSTLMIEIGTYQGQIAMKINFGYGLAAKNVGLVFKEKAVEDAQKVSAALSKLADILNDPKRTVLRVEKELSADIGLTFETAVQAGKIQ